MRNLISGFFLVAAVITQGSMALSLPESSVTIHGHGFGFGGTRIDGKSAAVSVEQNASTLTFTVPIAPIATGIDMRDRHLREILEAEKYPAAVLRVSREELRFPKPGEPARGVVKGELVLHGQSRMVETTYQAQLGATGRTRVRGSLQIDVRDFEIRYPSYLGAGIAPEVEVELEVELP